MSASIHEHPLGLTWTMDEFQGRSAHALVDEGRVWLIDPVDDTAAIERAQGLGEIAGVIQLLDRHNRDCAALSARFGVPHLVNPDVVEGAPLQCLPVVRGRKWRETALWWPERKALMVAEAVGTARAFTGGRRAGLHAMLRFGPPRQLTELAPEHLLVGHGPPIHGPDATPALRDAFVHPRRNIPRMLIGAFRNG